MGWLTLASTSRKDRDGKTRRNGSLGSDIDNYRKYYRHLLLGPLSLFRAHRDDRIAARATLWATPVMVEQLLRQELVPIEL